MAGNTVYVQGSYVDVHDNEVVNLSIDKAMVRLNDGSVNENEKLNEANHEEQNEEMFHFVHPELDETEAWRIHRAVKRLIANYRIPDICAYLKEQKQKGKLMLPSNPSVMYIELVRLGMPKGEGFSEKNFSNSYTK